MKKLSDDRIRKICERDRHAAVGNLWEERGQEQIPDDMAAVYGCFDKGGGMDIRSEVKSYIIREGLTMKEVVGILRSMKGWSGSASNFSDKLTRETIRYREVKDVADVLGYRLIWEKKNDK